MNIRGRTKETGSLPNPDSISESSGKTLTGWKEIARYLGRGVRTVQRYERDLALPVRRPACKDHGSVIATTEELDEWVNNSRFREAAHLEAASDSIAAEAGVIRVNVAEMHRLRMQMAGLRDDLEEALRLLSCRISELVDFRSGEAPLPQYLALTLPEGPPARVYQMLKAESRRRAG